MRILAVAAFCALAALPARAQQVEVIKAKGANAAGVCAGALDMTGQYMSRADNPDPAELQRVSRARDFFADLRLYPSADIANAASAFIQLMTGRIQKAPGIAERQAVEREIVELANECFRSAVRTLQAARQAAPPVQGQGIAPPVATQPVPTQPIPTQPLPTQPYVVQPGATQPLATQPILPAQ